MKLLLFALLFLNVVFFGFTQLVGSAHVPAAADGGPPVPRIALVSEVAATATHCVSIGPFTSEAAAAHAQDAAGARARVRVAEVAGPVSYWVAMPTKTLQDAARIVIRLRAVGVKDVDAVPPEVGATGASVSLGLYTERDRAERRVANLKPFAVNAKVIEQHHTSTSWWIDEDLPPGAAAPDRAALANLAGETGPVDQVHCPAPGTTAPPAAMPAPDAAPAATAAAGAPEPVERPVPANQPSPHPSEAKLPATPA